MTRNPQRIAALAERIAGRAEDLASHDPELRELVSEMKALSRSVPADRRRSADQVAAEADDLEDLFNNMPV